MFHSDANLPLTTSRVPAGTRRRPCQVHGLVKRQALVGIQLKFAAQHLLAIPSSDLTGRTRIRSTHSWTSDLIEVD